MAERAFFFFVAVGLYVLFWGLIVAFTWWISLWLFSSFERTFNAVLFCGTTVLWIAAITKAYKEAFSEKE